MRNKKRLMLTFMGTMLVGSLTGCGMMAALPGGGMAQRRAALPQISYESSPALIEYTAYAEDCAESSTGGETYTEQYKIYEPFGMTYDAARKELYYNGKAVRWFEDYYSIGSDPQAQAGRDFFNENGVVDVYAVRDFSNLVRGGDGSFDPSGKLTGLKEFTEEEFAARSIDAIKNPPAQVAFAGDPAASEEEMQEMAREYEKFGLTYDAKTDQWHWGGEKVRYFRDILTSNGESLGGGRFSGVMRSFGSEDGTVDVYPVRDYGRLNADGYGTLTGIEAVQAVKEFPGGRVDYTVYEPYGLIYDDKAGCYTYNRSVVRFFNDPAAGVSFTNFFTGTVDIEAKRDAGNRLIGIEECSKEVYDYHTKKYGNGL